MKILLLVVFIMMFALSVNAQLLNENFEYGSSNISDITTISSWVRHSGAQGPTYSATGLTYTGYTGSGIGGAISFLNGGSGTNDGDVNRTFTEVNTTGDVYVSFLLNVSSTLTEDYFLMLGQTVISTTFRGRVYARTNGTGWSLSLSKTGTPIVQDATVLNFNQTYLIVLKYMFNTTATTDDQVMIYAYASGIPTTEPSSPLLTIAATGSGVTDGVTNIGSVAIRQGTNTPTAKVDGIRIGTTWNAIFAATGVEASPASQPTKFVLEQNYPNPFNPATTIEFSLPVRSDVHLAVVNMLGQVVKEISNKEYSAGMHKVTLDASNLATGVYFYKLHAGGFVDVKRMLLVK